MLLVLPHQVSFVVGNLAKDLDEDLNSVSLPASRGEAGDRATVGLLALGQEGSEK